MPCFYGRLLGADTFHCHTAHSHVAHRLVAIDASTYWMVLIAPGMSFSVRRETWIGMTMVCLRARSGVAQGSLVRHRPASQKFKRLIGILLLTCRRFNKWPVRSTLRRQLCAICCSDEWSWCMLRELSRRMALPSSANVEETNQCGF